MTVFRLGVKGSGTTDVISPTIFKTVIPAKTGTHAERAK
jgi:hypothetical protein